MWSLLSICHILRDKVINQTWGCTVSPVQIGSLVSMLQLPNNHLRGEAYMIMRIHRLGGGMRLKLDGITLHVVYI